jgi:hypothetical protein
LASPTNRVSSGARGSKSVSDNTREASIGRAEKTRKPMMNGETNR